MYRTKEQVSWDNRNTANFAGGKKEGREEMVFEMLKLGIDITVIATCSKLSIEEITALKYGDFNQ